MLTADDFRRLVLSMPDAVEGAHMGHPDFRANGRIFASLHPDGLRGMVKLTPAQQRGVVREGGAFVPSSGAWGRQGCTDVRLADADGRAVQAAVTSAWENAMAMAAPRGKRKVTKEPARKRGRGTGRRD